jgi:hypothetical protein
VDVKPLPAWLRIGSGAVFLGLVAAFALGVLTEALILLATVLACALSLIPVLVDQRVRRGGDDRLAGHPARAWRGHQGV